MGRLQSRFSAHQIDVLIGSLLGDARLECRSIGVRSPVTARFRVHQGFKQKDYVFWKYEIMRDFVIGMPRESSWTNDKRRLHEVSYYFHTKSLKELGILYHYFYKNGVKILPDDIFGILNPRMIAVWFMDDGSNNGNSCTLNTHSFSLEDQMRIVDFLKEKYAINSKIVKDRDKWKLSMGKYDFPKLIYLIEPYMIPSMSYKIANPRNDLSVFNRQSENKTVFANTSVPEMEGLEKV